MDLLRVPDSLDARLLFSDLRLELEPGGGFPNKAWVSDLVMARWVWLLLVTGWLAPSTAWWPPRAGTSPWPGKSPTIS